MSIMSLEDLLAEEGFKRRKPKLNSSRNSIASSEGRIKTLINGRNSSGPLMTTPKRTGRTRSDVPRYDLRADFPPGVGFSSHKTRSRYNKVKGVEKFNVSSSSKRLVAASHEITEASDSDDVVETGKNKPYKDIYLNRVYGSDEVISIENDAITHKGSIRSSKKQPLITTLDKRSSFKTVSGDENKLDEFKKRQAQPQIDQTLTSPALDELAVKAVLSILMGPAKNFRNDGEFRSSLRHNSFASLNFFGPDEEGGPNTESKVVENLERAIETVERAAEDRAATSKEVKRASLQLSVITGLGPKDGLTSGIPNSQLSACAHLYLGVIYAMQSKDGISSKHLLQVFRDSPRQARTVLLPDLWDRLFQPHLSQLKRWFETEAEHLSDSSDYENDLRRLERAYDEALDSGTREIAIYYRDWISEGVEAPSLPIIETPSFSVRVVTKGAFDEGRLSKLSPQPMVSKRLYDEVFRFSGGDSKSVGGSEICEEDGIEVNVPEEKQLILYSHTLDTRIDTGSERDHHEDFPHDLATKIEAHQLISYQETSNINEDSGNNPLYFSFLALPPPDQEDKSVTNSPENRSIECRLIEESAVINASKHFPNAEETENSLALIAEPKLPVQEQKDYDTKPSRVLVPKDFLCPLTGLLFEEPVTIETGRTYERRAITEWFDKGYLTCPLTRKTLQCRTVPPTNPILKRVIDEWKMDHFSHLLALISIDEREEVRDDNVVCVLKQLLIQAVFSEEQRVKNARRVISIGGLDFLLRKFNGGGKEEKGRFFLPMILCCVEADGGCRDKVARDINRLDLLEMLRCDSLETRNGAVSLLVELVCMNRRIGALRFLNGLGSDEIVTALNDICIHIEGCPLEEKPLVSVLILHLDLLTEKSEANNDGIYYRQKAVDALTTALEKSLLSDDELRRNCSRALLMLGGFFSKSGKLMTEDHMLKLAGFLNCPEWDPADSTVEDEEEEEEEAARNMWLGKASISLLGDGKKSFLGAVSKCLSLGDTDSIRVCLTTLAWLSFSLALLPDEEASEFRAYALSGLMSPLKQCMEYQERVEHKVLASFSLLSFSKNQECRELMMEMGEEMVTSLENLAEVTWTAKELRDVMISLKRSYKRK